MYISANTIEFTLIVILIIYVIYLQLQLTKKNILLKTVYDRIDKPKSKLDKQDILQFLENIKNPEYSGTVTRDKLLDKKISRFLFENESEINLFLHYTTSEKIANKIIVEGFKFVNSFYKTAEYIYNDQLYLVHRHHEHKQYGSYVIVICISKNTYNHFTKELNTLKTKNIAVEQVLTELPHVIDENLDEIYTLPQQFIKGYFNYLEGTIVNNPYFDYNFTSEKFQENLIKFRDSK